MTNIRSNYQQSLQRIDRNKDGIVQRNEAKLVGYRAKSGDITKQEALDSLAAAKKANAEHPSAKDKASVKLINSVIEDVEANVVSFPSAGPRTPPKQNQIPPVGRIGQPKPVPGGTPPTPGSAAYEQLVNNGAPLISGQAKQQVLNGLKAIDDVLNSLEIPIVKENAEKLKEASLDLGRYGTLGVVAGTVGATTVEFFVPTSIVDFIPGGKIIRKGKKISTIRMTMEELKGLPKAIKNANYENKIREKLSKNIDKSTSKIPSIESPIPRELRFEDKTPVRHVQAGEKNYAWSKTLNGKLEPDATYYANNIQYNTNADSLVETVAGEVKAPGNRSKGQQTKIAKLYGKEGDHGGHIAATILGGPGEAINLMPQNKLFNNSEWKKMENELKKAYDDPNVKGVSFKVKLQYGEKSYPNRPSKLIVETIIDGKEKRRVFKNKPEGK